MVFLRRIVAVTFILAGAAGSGCGSVDTRGGVDSSLSVGLSPGPNLAWDFSIGRVPQSRSVKAPAASPASPAPTSAAAAAAPVDLTTAPPAR